MHDLAVELAGYAAGKVQYFCNAKLAPIHCISKLVKNKLEKKSFFEINKGFEGHLRNVFPLKIGRVLHDMKHNSCHAS